MEEQKLHKAPVVTVTIKTESDWEGNQETSVRREFLERDVVTWPMIMEVFYGAIRGFDYHFFPKTEETLENLANDDYDWSGEEESEKDNE